MIRQVHTLPYRQLPHQRSVVSGQPFRNGLFEILSSGFVFSEEHRGQTPVQVFIVPFLAFDVDDLNVEGCLHLASLFSTRPERPFYDVSYDAFMFVS